MKRMAVVALLLCVGCQRKVVVQQSVLAPPVAVQTLTGSLTSDNMTIATNFARGDGYEHVSLCRANGYCDVYKSENMTDSVLGFITPNGAFVIIQASQTVILDGVSRASYSTYKIEVF